MKTIKLFPILITLLLLFAACDKNKPDERIYGRWKITGYQLDGVGANDTIQKYYHDYEYEISSVGKDAQGTCSCNSAVRIYDYGVPTIPDKSNLYEKSINTGVLNFFRTTPPACATSPTSLMCIGTNVQTWKYSFTDNDMMEWNITSTTNHSHKFIFTRIN